MASTPAAPEFNLNSIVVISKGTIAGPFAFFSEARPWADRYFTEKVWSLLDTNDLPEPLRSNVLSSIIINPLGI